jgi:hypothetical protein
MREIGGNFDEIVNGEKSEQRQKREQMPVREITSRPRYLEFKQQPETLARVGQPPGSDRNWLKSAVALAGSWMRPGLCANWQKNHEQERTQMVRRKGERYHTVLRCPCPCARNNNMVNNCRISMHMNAFFKMKITAGEKIPDDPSK